MRDIFCELLSIKEPQTTLQNKEATTQNYKKFGIKIPRRALALSLRLLIVRGRWERMILAI